MSREIENLLAGAVDVLISGAGQSGLVVSSQVTLAIGEHVRVPRSA